jgi:hypothetical protein
MNSAWPICGLVRPSATSASTSTSRRVRPSEAAEEASTSGEAVVSTGSGAEAASLGEQLDLAPQGSRAERDRGLVG